MKKIIIALLIILNLFSVVSYAEAIMLADDQKAELYNLGIMTGDENGDLRPADTITRAEAVKMLCVAGNIKSQQETPAEFPDVPESHWAYNYICAAKEFGIISGDENGYFNPENPVSNEEIIKMLICVLGYDAAAEMQGGYPSGYIAQAARLGITLGMELDINTAAIRNDVGLMVLNSLDIPLMLKEDDFVYVIADGLSDIPLQTLRNKFEK